MQDKIDKMDDKITQIIGDMRGIAAKAQGDLTKAVLKANATIEMIKSEGLSMLNASKLVSELMSNLSLVKSIKGTDKKILILQILESIMGDSADADVIRTIVPGMIDDFHVLIRAKRNAVSACFASLPPTMKCYK